MRRRRFLAGSAALLAAAGARSDASRRKAEEKATMTRPSGALTDVEGIRVGHHTDSRRPTGCTVVLAEESATAGVDVRGGAPGTRETALLDPVNTVSAIHAIVLAGGSVFGLAAADGAVRYLAEKRVGFPMPDARIPIVPAAILYDLNVGDAEIRPTPEWGYAAAKAAAGGPDARLAQGNVGAGAGASVGKLMGRERAMKGGLGTASLKLPGGLVVGALVAVNSVGDVYHYESGQLMAGARTADGKHLADVAAMIRRGEMPAVKGLAESTTIGVVATNAVLSKSQAAKVAQMAHDGLARTIRPVHTPFDGDTLFAVSTGKLRRAGAASREPAFVAIIGALAADAVAQAVVAAILHAASIPGIPSYSDFRRKE